MIQEILTDKRFMCETGQKLEGFRFCWEFYTVFYLVLINAVAQGDGRFNKRNHDYKQYKEN